MRRLVLLPLAISDLRGITRYSRQTFGERQTRLYIGGIRASCRDLAAGRLIGKACDDPIPGLWKKRTGSHVIYYHLWSPGDLSVVRILHGSMNHEDHLWHTAP